MGKVRKISRGRLRVQTLGKARGLTSKEQLAKALGLSLAALNMRIRFGRGNSYKILCEMRDFFELDDIEDLFTENPLDDDSVIYFKSDLPLGFDAVVTSRFERSTTDDLNAFCKQKDVNRSFFLNEVAKFAMRKFSNIEEFRALVKNTRRIESNDDHGFVEMVR